jgi:predicted transcriptional regulator
MYMKKRITISIDPEISRRAKQLARQRKTTVSGLIQDLIAQSGQGDSNTARESFVTRWEGKLKIQRRKDDPRFAYLEAKYLSSPRT